MEQKTLRVRFASPADAAALLELYRPYVTDTAITFEYDVPSVEEFARRIGKTLTVYPYLTAELGGEPVGYAYAGSFVGRAAYAWSAESSIYVRRDSRKQGVGRALYQALELGLRAMGVTNLNACIGAADPPDEYLDNNSLEFHRHLGFSMVGRFHGCGCKFGRWYDMVWMEKLIGPHTRPPTPVAELQALRPALERQLEAGAWRL